jgi:carbon storage regulator
MEGNPILVLNRKLGERTLIGEGIEVTVLEIKRHSVKLGFSAPLKCRVMREEAKGKREKEAADHD